MGNKTWHKVEFVVLGLLVASACGAWAAEATYKLLGRETGGFAAKADLATVVNYKVGARASLADWEELKAKFGGNEAALKGLCEKMGLAPNSSAWVTRGGNQFWQEQRRYFIYRADHKPPPDFMAHDQLQNNFLILGSWYGTRCAVVKVTNYNAADEAKWAAWDKQFQEAGTKDISGAYTLISVNGQRVPASVPHEGGMIQVRSGTFTITGDGKCSSRMTFVPPGRVEATLERKATYNREGPTLNMQWENAGDTTGTIKSDTFTMENEGMVFAYKKSNSAR